MSSPMKVPVNDGDGTPQSRKLLKRLAKAQYRAQQKVERAAAVANGQDSGQRQRKRRSQRDCNRQGTLKRLATVDASGCSDQQPEIQYVACTSQTCGSSGGGGDISIRRCRLRVVAPYVHRFETFVKARWCGRTLSDVFLHDFAGLSVDYCQAAIAMGLIRINGQPSESEYVLHNGDFLEHIMHRHEPAVHILGASLSAGGNYPSAALVHYDEAEVVVVNKPSSVPVHPSGAYLHNSMTLLLQKECAMPELFPVHRLDRLTSGLLMLSKSAAKAKALCDDIASGKVQKHYVARVLGEFPVVTIDSDEAEGDMPGISRPFDSSILQTGLAQIYTTQLNGETYWRLSALIGCVSSAEHIQGVVANETSKTAETLMRRLSFDGTHSVVECLPITGRTHQIRVHLQYLGFPIVNDPLYGPEGVFPVPNGEHEGENGSREVVAVENKSNSAPATDEQSANEMDGNLEASGMTTQCESICSACKDGESTIFSAVHQHCFTMWLHSFKYKSAKWTFEVPLPPWALMPPAIQSKA